MIDIWRQCGSGKCTTKSTLTTQHQSPLYKLRKYKSLTKSKREKGRKVVLVNKTNYINKMNSIPSVSTEFQKISNAKAMNMRAEKTLTNSSNELKKLKNVPASHDSPKPIGLDTPCFYALPKVYKSGPPLRPDMYKSPLKKSLRHFVLYLQGGIYEPRCKTDDTSCSPVCH